jgi:Uma2 family endonuclease
VETVEQVKHALERLSWNQREIIVDWLQNRPTSMTVDEYMELEGRSERRHEYANGFVYTMHGSSTAHARIATELVRSVGDHLRGGPCKVFSSNCLLEIRSDTDEVYYYPDLMVACNPEQWDRRYVRHPRLVGEIFSPSTRRIDLHEKAMTYQQIASVEECVLVPEDPHRGVIVQRREESWRPVTHTGPEAVVELRSIGLSLPLSQIYAGVL